MFCFLKSNFKEVLNGDVEASHVSIREIPPHPRESKNHLGLRSILWCPLGRPPAVPWTWPPSQAPRSRRWLGFFFPYPCCFSIAFPPLESAPSLLSLGRMGLNMSWSPRFRRTSVAEEKKMPMCSFEGCGPWSRIVSCFGTWRSGVAETWLLGNQERCESMMPFNLPLVLSILQSKQIVLFVCNGGDEFRFEKFLFVLNRLIIFPSRQSSLAFGQILISPLKKIGRPKVGMPVSKGFFWRWRRKKNMNFYFFSIFWQIWLFWTQFGGQFEHTHIFKAKSWAYLWFSVGAMWVRLWGKKRCLPGW